MQDGAGRILGGLTLLVALWIGVYWWWPSEPPISFAPNNQQGTTPTPGPEQVPGESSEPPPEVVIESPRPPPGDPPRTEPKPIAVVPPQFTEHVVRNGESFATIAQKYYGSARYATVVSKANPFVDPNRLKAGRVLRIPKDPDNIQGIPAAEPDPEPAAPAVREYEVQPGDSLSKISQKMYGTTKYSSLIFEANRGILKNEDDIRAGDKLKIPPKPAE